MRASIVAACLVLAACSANDGTTPHWDGVTDGGPCDPTACSASCADAGLGSGTCISGSCVCTGGGDGTTDGAIDPGGDTVLVTGRVWSPGAVVPISGALVYFGLSEPDPIPSGAYPETCVDPPSPYFVETNPDGTFQMHVLPGSYHLVVQKGQFRRVRNVTVEAPGPLALEESLTTLPHDYGPGDTIPSMALVWALEGGDHIEDVLAKVSMGTVGSDHRLQRGSENFDLYNISGYPPVSDLYYDLDLMKSYHIIFFPCTIWDYFGVQLEDPVAPLSDPVVRDNLRAFVASGGKIYATDMMYDVFEQPLPDYVDVCGDDATPNAGDEEAWAHTETMSGWTSYGYAVDPDLAAWLDATGIGSTGLDFRENFVWIEGLMDIPDPLPDGPKPPYTWVEGNFILDPGRTLPLTVTFPYESGKVLFSTYHTVGDGSGSSGHDGIYPQEYVLLYLIMEIGVCQDPIY